MPRRRTPGPDPHPAADGRPVAGPHLDPGRLLWARRASLAVIGLLTLGGTLFLVLHFGEVEAFAAQAARAEPLWLLAGAAMQAATYFCAGLVWWIVLVHYSHRLPVLSLAPLGLAKLFVDEVMPLGGLSGSLLVSRGLVRRGIPAGEAVTAFVFGTGAFAGGFALATLAAILLLALHHRASPAVLAAAGGFVVIILAVTAFLFLLARNGPEILPARLARHPFPRETAEVAATAVRRLVAEPGLYTRVLAVQLLVRALDGLTLWLCFRAIGLEAPLWACFAAIVLASVAMYATPVPMGLGTFEAGAIGTLALSGLPVEAALTATLLFRGLALWLPLVPGFILSQRELRAAVGPAP